MSDPQSCRVDRKREPGQEQAEQWESESDDALRNNATERQTRKRPRTRGECGADLQGPALIMLRLVDVVADYAAENRSGCATDDCTLHLVLAGDRANHCTSAGADRGVTLGVLHDRRLRRRGRSIDRSGRISTRRARRRAATSGRGSANGRPRSTGGARQRLGWRGGRSDPGALRGGDAVERSVRSSLCGRRKIGIQRIIDLLVVAPASESEERGRKN